MDFRIISRASILEMPKDERANFINALSGFKSANLIGSINAEGLSNLAIFNSVMHIGANPPLMGFIQRPASVARHTYENIKQNGCFTINHVSESFYKQAHQTSARYGAQWSEFEAVGLSEVYHESFSAPYIAEAQLSIGLRFAEEHHIGANDTILVIGAVEWVRVAENAYLPDGMLDLEQLQTVAVSGLDWYYEAKSIARLPYAKPEEGKR